MRDSLETFLTLLITEPNQYQHLQALLTNQPNTPAVDKNNLKVIFRWLPRFIEYTERLNHAQYRYSLEVETFVDCLKDHPLDPSQLCFLATVCQYPKPNRILEIDSLRHWLSDFLHDLRQRLLSPQLQKEIALQQKQVNRNYKTMCQYVDTLFAHHARQVVIRVDLGYVQDAPVTLEQFEDDLNRLYEHTRTKPLFNHLNGFIYKIEYGITKGLHAHLLLFFDGSKRNGYGAWDLAKSIGEYWKNVIVSELGSYWNSHDDVKKYQQLGLLAIGIVHVNDTVAIHNLKTHVIDYLCRRKQYIKPRNRPKMRLIRKGDMPKIPTVKRGAPRKVVTI